MIIVAFFGLLLFLLAVASPLHKPVRRTLHPTLVGVTIKQLPLVSATQGYCSRWLDLAVLLSAATITIEVYLTFLPLLIWSGNHHFVVCGLLPQLALAGYVVFAIKDLLVGLHKLLSPVGCAVVGPQTLACVPWQPCS